METTFEEYYEQAQNALKEWLDLHTDPETWADDYIDGWQDAWQTGHLSNDYWHFNLKAAYYEKLAEDQLFWFERCDHCGAIICTYDGQECSCFEGEGDEDGNPREESFPSSKLTENDLDDLCEYLEMFENQPTEQEFYSLLIEEAFPVYARALAPIIRGVVEEVKACLLAFEEAQTFEEGLTALTWANHVMHVNGNILADYGGLNQTLIDQVSNGINQVWSEEEIKAFFEELGLLGD